MHKKCIIATLVLSAIFINSASAMQKKRKLSTSSSNILEKKQSTQKSEEEPEILDATQPEEQDEESIQEDRLTTLQNLYGTTGNALCRLADETDAAHRLSDINLLLKKIKKNNDALSINNRNGLHQTPLLLAAYRGHTNLMELFLKNGARLNGDWVSPLQGAAHGTNAATTLPLLLEMGGNPEDIKHSVFYAERLKEINNAIKDHKVYATNLLPVVASALKPYIHHGGGNYIVQIIADYVTLPLLPNYGEDLNFSVKTKSSRLINRID